MPVGSSTNQSHRAVPRDSMAGCPSLVDDAASAVWRRWLHHVPRLDAQAPWVSASYMDCRKALLSPFVLHHGAMTPPHGLREILRTVAQRMQADFEASGFIEHRGSKGTVRERDLRSSFLDKYLPRDVEVLGSSEVVDATGAVSGQCDILLVDPGTPPLWAAEDLRVVPAECVHIVIEVKSNLTSDELRSAWHSVRRVKALAKGAYMTETGLVRRTLNVYGRDWDHTPTFAHVFAFDGATIGTLGDTFAELVRGEPDPALRLDSVFVLNRGTLLWEEPETHMIRGVAREGDFVCGAEAAPDEVLMQFLAHLTMELNAVIPRRFDPRAYMSGNLGEARYKWTFDW